MTTTITTTFPEDTTAFVSIFDGRGTLLLQVWTRGEAAAQLEWDVAMTRVRRKGDPASRCVRTWRDGRHPAVETYP